jgi:hypothetical protein
VKDKAPELLVVQMNRSVTKIDIGPSVAGVTTTSPHVAVREP